MSCGGGLTGLVMAAAGGMVTNGSLSGTFGGAPLSSIAGAPISVTDAITGQTLAPTLATVSSSIGNISGTVLSGTGGSLTSVMSSLGGSSLTSNMVSSWNGIADNVTGGALMEAIGGFSPDLNSTLTSITGSSSINDAFGYASEWAGKQLGGTGTLSAITGDAKKFGSILTTAQTYVSNANQLINSAVNSETIGTTFTGLNNMVSGGLAGVNLDFGGFGEEIAKLGGTIDFSNLKDIGNPGQMLANLSKEGTLGPLYNKLGDIEIDSRTALSLGSAVAEFSGNAKLKDLGVDLNALAQQGAGLPPGLQTKVYDAFDALDIEEVAQVKNILGNTQDIVESGTDLFDPKKLFPESFQTLQAPLRTASVGFRSIYQNNTGSVNPQFDDLGKNLKGIIPDDQAVANGALARTLGQVKNIGSSNTSTLGTALTSLESLKGLNLLEEQEEYVTDAIRDYWKDTYGTDSIDDISLATGNAGQYKLSDVIGFSAGYNSAAPLKQNEELLQELKDSGDLDDIIGTGGVYDTVIQFNSNAEDTDGSWVSDDGAGPPPTGYAITIPNGYLAAGRYPTSGFETNFTDARESAWNAIVSAVQGVLNALDGNEKVALITRNTKRYNEQLIREYRINEKMNQDLDDVFSSEDIALNFALSLPNLGTDTSEGGSAELLERVMNFDSLSGQAAIAAMREGRNIERLGNANIQQDVIIDDTIVENPATLASGQYTSTEALNKLTKS